MRQYFVYILTNRIYGTLSIGVTSNLNSRIIGHKQKQFKGFTSKYSVDKLVWYEEYQYIEDAILREKRLKKWNRAWKIRLINEMNPRWEDLAAGAEEGFEDYNQ